MRNLYKPSSCTPSLFTIYVTLKLQELEAGFNMQQQYFISAIFLVSFIATSNQEMQHHSQPVVSSPPNHDVDYIACAQMEDLNSTMQQGLQEIREELQDVKELLSTVLSLHHSRGYSPSHPAHSCKEIYDRNTSSPSGYYWLVSSSEKFTRVYCDMERTCGGVEGGWMKVTSLDMKEATNLCPSGLKTLTSPRKLCAMNINGGGCSSAYLDVQGVEYYRVCGKITGYQQKTPDAFLAYYYNRALTIDQTYVDGISLTHGKNPRKHIWTFAAALHETLLHPYTTCPCTNTNNHLTIPVPPYVGNDYFCDTASSQIYEFRFYPEDPLWDGQGCGRLNTCCSFNNPPWFMKQLPASTHDNIEVRLCADGSRSDEDITFETLELYVQ